MMPRIHLEQALASGDSLALPAPQSRHLQVLRLQPGSALCIFDGAGSEWHATIAQIGRRTVDVRIGDRLADAGREPARRVTLAIGVPANDRMDLLIEKATELGVATIQPLQCERSVLRLKGERAAARRSRWTSIAAAASEQCGRRWVPGVAAPRELVEWLGEAAGSSDAVAAPPARWLLSLDPAAPTPAVRRAAIARETPLVVLSGPEGGLTEREEDAAVERGFLRVSLGPRVLRADTAPLALLAWLGVAEL